MVCLLVCSLGNSENETQVLLVGAMQQLEAPVDAICGIASQRCGRPRQATRACLRALCVACRHGRGNSSSGTPKRDPGAVGRFTVNRNHPLKAWKVRRPSHMNPRRPVRTVDRHASENHSHTANDSPPPPHPISDPQSGSGTGTRVAAVALGAVGLCVRGYFYAGWTLRTGFARSREPRLATSSVNFTATAAELAAYHSRVDAIHYALSELLAPSSVLSMDCRFRWACTADLTPHGTRGCVVPSTLWELRQTVAHSAAALAARWARRRRAERYLGVAHAGSPDRERGRYPISPCSPLSPRSAPPSSPPSLPPATPPPRRAATTHLPQLVYFFSDVQLPAGLHSLPISSPERLPLPFRWGGCMARATGRLSSGQRGLQTHPSPLLQSPARSLDLVRQPTG